jgi:protein-export membrane protein SecD/preprotein translocase SecF subunit
MRTKRIWLRLLVVTAVAAASAWTIYPPRDTIKLGLDLKGGANLVLRVKGDPGPADTREQTIEQAQRTVERRVNELGVAESVVARYGDGDQILVQLPGVADVEQAKQIIKSTAQLRLTLVENGPFATRDAAVAAYNGSLPADLEVLPGPANADGKANLFYAVRKAPAVSGGDLREVRQARDDFSRPAVAFTLEPEAGSRFGAFTSQHVNRPLATVLDNRVTAVATIIDRIDERGLITGLTHDEMVEQVINFRSGALPADLEYVEEHTVGAALGEAAIRSGVTASVGGLTLVALFMLGYYRLSGLNALISILLNLLILVALIAYVPVTMTLPGIAGLILTIGMGVDSNVLIFERIKEELAKARSASAAITAGFDRVWITIVDTHVTSLIAAAVLYNFGTIPIRGFATTLTIGLLANVFTAVFVSRTIFEVTRRLRRVPAASLSIGRRTAAPSRLLDFTRWNVPAMALSAALIGAGLISMMTRGLPLGIDFSGGTLIVVEFARPGTTETDVRAAVAPLPGDEVVQRFGPAEARQWLIRLPQIPLDEAGDRLEAGAERVTQALQAAAVPAFEIVDRQLVSAAISTDLQRRAVYATLTSLVAIAAYIAARFRPSFALGAIAATLHDVLITLACLSWAGYDLTLSVMAALLTIVGYSVNDTIVVFDRVRENLKAMPHQPLATVVNLSVNQTLSRTVITLLPVGNVNHCSDELRSSRFIANVLKDHMDVFD